MSNAAVNGRGPASLRDVLRVLESRVRSFDLSRSARQVAHELIGLMRATGRPACVVKQKTIAERIGCSVRTVVRAMRELYGRGVLQEPSRQNGGRRIGCNAFGVRRWLANAYVFAAGFAGSDRMSEQNQIEAKRKKEGSFGGKKPVDFQPGVVPPAAFCDDPEPVSIWDRSNERFDARRGER